MPISIVAIRSQNTRDQIEHYILCEEVLGTVAIQLQVTTIHVYLRCDRNVILTKLRCDRNVVDLMHASLIHHLSQRTEEDNESCNRQYKYSAKRWKRSKSAEVTASYRTLRCTCSVVFLLFWALSFALSFVLSLALSLKILRS